ncbi:MAG: hypothetical protein E7773_11185 [Sphingomonas sp.]|uniref:hypothetical protein n=1 Tax=Sphingomonas sp. TaxID=28214 RepID=UPI0012007620|nr:hypothetical protein [Sphingomonas sp.]THD35024.1 MAG: hypothetical protein E7773_11185 [Sphingomonas sp.]
MPAKQTFNLSAFADRLIAEKRKLDLAWTIKNMIGLQSISVDLRIALEACDALAFSLDTPMNQPAEFRETSEAALMSYIVLLYARAAKTSSEERKQFDPLPYLNDAEKIVHKELCDLRDRAVAHYGTGGSYVGNWVREIAVLEVEGITVRTGALSRRQIIDRHLIARAKTQIERVIEIVDPIVAQRIAGVMEALNVEAKADPEFYKEVHAHPLNVTLFLGNAESVVEMQNTPDGGRNRGAFGHSG